MRKLFFVAIFSVAAISLQAASMSIPNPMSKSEILHALVIKHGADGALSFKEIKEIATVIKGSELSVIEKIAIRMNKKKIEKNFMSGYFSGEGKSQLTAVLLCFFLGGLGIHRFYMGYTWQGIVQLLTLGGLGVWTLIDFVRLLTGSLQPKDAEWAKTL